MQNSRATGVFRKQERKIESNFRTKGEKTKTASSTGSKDKPFKFALLACKDVDSDEPHGILKKDIILDRGIVSLNERDNEAAIREKLVSSLQGKYGMIGRNDFGHVKVNQKVKEQSTIIRSGQKLIGQWLLFIRMRKGFEFVI